MTNYSLILARNFGVEIIKLPWQHPVYVSAKIAAKSTSFPGFSLTHPTNEVAAKFQKVMNEDVRALKDALGYLNIRKSTSRRILSGIFSRSSENYELKSTKELEFSVDNQFDEQCQNPRL